ncbi:hypothetical protein [Nonomuraea sp. NPDC005501]
MSLNGIRQSQLDHRLKRLLETGTRLRCPVFDQVFTDMWERSTPL